MMRDEGTERCYVFIAFPMGIEYILANDVSARGLRYYKISIAILFALDVRFSGLTIRQPQLALFDGDGLGYVDDL